MTLRRVLVWSAYRFVTWIHFATCSAGRAVYPAASCAQPKMSPVRYAKPAAAGLSKITEA
jgi:hypothetical protein